MRGCRGLSASSYLAPALDPGVDRLHRHHPDAGGNVPTGDPRLFLAPATSWTASGCRAFRRGGVPQLFRLDGGNAAFPARRHDARDAWRASVGPSGPSAAASAAPRVSSDLRLVRRACHRVLAHHAARIGGPGCCHLGFFASRTRRLIDAPLAHLSRHDRRRPHSGAAARPPRRPRRSCAPGSDALQHWLATQSERGSYFQGAEGTCAAT